MIAMLSGTVAEKKPSQVIIDVGGVGYRLFISLSTYEKLPPKDEKIKLHVVTIAREDALHLFGFFDNEEKEIFNKLITVSRVGPKLAIQALSGINPEDLVTAIANNDITKLSRVHGLGKKTAERIILELKDKLTVSGAGQTVLSGNADIRDSVEALVNLGYKRAQAEKAVMEITAVEKDLAITDLIRKALKSLSK